MNIFVLNCGSSSLKFQLINMETEEKIVKGNYERIGDERSVINFKVRGEKKKIDKFASNHEEAIRIVIDILVDKEYGIINSLDEINAIGHRIVHGGEKYSKSILITKDVISGIKECIPLAPLHNPAGVDGIEAIKKVLPNLPMVATFDTAFHQTIPEIAYIYQLPYRYYEEYKIRKYGFHGTSHKYVSDRVTEILNRDNKDLKIINCHLGQGASLCAVKNGISIETSMGLTPTSGIPMGTRCGDIDPAIIPYIMNLENLTLTQVENVLNKESGAWGISGVSTNYIDIEEAYNKGNKRAMLALEAQAYKVAQYIAQYMVSLGGLDVLTFSGGVGEKGFEARERICNHLGFLGFKLDKEKNKVKAEERCLSSENSKYKIYSIPTDEELMIAKDTMEIIKGL